MIITIGGTKGGTGKSTLACNFAVLASRALGGMGRVLLVDADAQGSSAEFASIRADLMGDSGFTAVRLDHRGLRSQLRSLAISYDLIIIDVAGTDSMAQREALLHSHRPLAPFVHS